MTLTILRLCTLTLLMTKWYPKTYSMVIGSLLHVVMLRMGIGAAVGLGIPMASGHMVTVTSHVDASKMRGNVIVH